MFGESGQVFLEAQQQNLEAAQQRFEATIHDYMSTLGMSRYEAEVLYIRPGDRLKRPQQLHAG